MAQSISDVFSRGRDNDGGRRRARLVRNNVESASSASDETRQPRATRGDHAGQAGRRAAYRPAETLALRRDVLDAYTAAVMRDGHVAEKGGQHLLDAARAAEVLGHYEEAFSYLREFERQEGQWDWDSAVLRRRVLRGVEATDLVTRSLETSTELSGAPTWAPVYTALELARQAYEGGEDVHRVRQYLDQVVEAATSKSQLGGFAALWAMQIGCDIELEAGAIANAFDGLTDAIELPELTVDIRQSLEARRAVWMHVFGRHEDSRHLLDDLAQRGVLSGDLDDLLVSLSFENGERQRAFDVLRSTASDRCRHLEHAVPLVMMHAVQDGQSATGRNILREATQHRDDWTLLSLHEAFCDTATGDTQRAGSELIDVLNRRLEGPLSTDERVNLLTRLGRLYEVEADLEEAAAEVYREALTYDPQHVPALRALGRLYTRRQNWKALAELYEREIATLSHRPGAWRRHFQLAEIYEQRLDRPERALENYLIVLDEKPHYLPALKSSARILGQLDRWTQLADLFLRMVDSAPTRRQKLYLLDKVAEVAEERLSNYEVAIGAWRETLEIDPENPRAYSALGRLYAHTHRWEELIELNESELGLIDDPEEQAAILLRNAQIAERHLEDVEGAEAYYRQTLAIIPDYLPALEALGRIYLRGGRWADIVAMTGRELETVSDPDTSHRQLGALAEILETKLDRRDDAIAIYQTLWQQDPGNGHVFGALKRLYRATKRWADLEEVLEHRLEHCQSSQEFASLTGELAILSEWRLENREVAYQRYLSALKADPDNIHWLSGVARTWSDASIAVEDVANELEDLLMKVCEGDVRDRYFKVIARLRERQEGGPEASRAYRAHGDATSLENQIVMRLAMAVAGERRRLAEARASLPHHALQPLLQLDRRIDADECPTFDRELLGDRARQWFAGELPPEVSGALRDKPNLSDDLVAILDGAELHHDDPESIKDQRRRLRLRALQARRVNDHGAYLQWTRQEMELLTADAAATRRLELARYATRKGLPQEATLYREVCKAIFPELSIDGDDLGDEDLVPQAPAIPTEQLHRLYDALRDTERWDLLRQCREAQVSRPELARDERLEVFEELAALYREQLGDYEGARDALVHCYQLSENLSYLNQIVELARQEGATEDAIKYQKKHFEKRSMSADASAADRVASGLTLARLHMERDEEEHREAAIRCLEHLIDAYGDAAGIVQAKRLLARAHAAATNPVRAAELFESALHFQVRGDEVEDWRRLVEIYRLQLGDVDRAYQRQWNLVRSFPNQSRDLDVLIDLAGEAGELADCVRQLQELASSRSDDAKASLLARAAEAADEELGHAEEAFHLFERVLDLVDGDHPRYQYFRRRRAVCLARMAGREDRAHRAFRQLLDDEPFEPATHRGMEILFERAGTHDRLRITRQTLRMLGCQVDQPKAQGKVHPTRTLGESIIRRDLMPDAMSGGIFDILQEAMPLVEKVFSDDLPQKKALDGRRIKGGQKWPIHDDLQAALLAFGITRFKLYVGESGPDQPMVFASKTPVIWLNQGLVEDLNEAESRFIAGYCAALVWSGLPALMALDGRQVWHLLEGVFYRQSGEGFSERVDVQSQRMADEVSSPFDMPQRRAIAKAIEACDQDLEACHCEAWGRALQDFAARAGLLLCGDLAAAAKGLLRLSGWKMGLEDKATQKRIKNQEGVRDLLLLAHSEEYLELRYKTGLAGRPSRVGT